MTLVQALEIADEVMHRRTSDTSDPDEQHRILEAMRLLDDLRQILSRE